MKILNIDSSYETSRIEKELKDNKNIKYIFFKHETNLKDGENLITEARKDGNKKEILVYLANNGFYLYSMKENNTISAFVQHFEIPNMWQRIKQGDFQVEHGIVYELEKPIKENGNLLVIFSCINSPIYQSSLMRMFTKNFSKISDFIPENTQILRIADIQGIVGTANLNSNYNPNYEDDIQKLIKDIKSRYKLNKVVLLGASKGGTSAVYHGLLGNYDFVAVDPIISDHFYFMKYNDTHFVKNISKEEKDDVFKKIFSSKLNTISDTNKCVITSRNSPQYHYINYLLLEKYSKNISLFLNIDEEIKDHPDVSPKSLFKTTELVNSCLNDEIIDKKVVEFIDKL